MVEVAIDTVPVAGLAAARLEQVLVERYPDLLRLAFLLMRDQDEAADVTQLALERAWRSRDQVRSSDSAVHWLRRTRGRGHAGAGQSVRLRDGRC